VTRIRMKGLKLTDIKDILIYSFDG